jgi:hypothetical protein
MLESWTEQWELGANVLIQEKLNPTPISEKVRKLFKFCAKGWELGDKMLIKRIPT